MIVAASQESHHLPSSKKQTGTWDTPKRHRVQSTSTVRSRIHGVDRTDFPLCNVGQTIGFGSRRNRWRVIGRVIPRVHPEDSEVVHSENQRAGLHGRIQLFPIAQEGDRVPAGKSIFSARTGGVRGRIIPRLHPEDSEIVDSENYRASIHWCIQLFSIRAESDRVAAGRKGEAFSEWNLPAGGDVQILGKRGAVDLQVARVGVGAAQAHLQVVEDFLYEAVFAILGMLP